jgi:hypothetical protein
MDGGGIFDQVVANARSAASRLLVRSALNPMLWLCGIISLPCFMFAVFVRDVWPLALLLLCIGSAPIIGTIVGFLYLMVVAPEKLQSEEYQIRHEALEVIKQKGTRAAISPSSVVAIANPVRSTSTSGGGA